MVGMPTTDEFQHQFLGLVSPRLPNGQRNPAYDDVDLDGVRDGRVRERAGFIREAYAESDATLKLARSLVGRDPTTFVGLRPRVRAAVPGHRRQPAAGRPRTAVATADLQLPPGTGETIGKAKACWAGGALQIYLNLAGRDPAGGGLQQVAAADEAATVAAIRAKYLGLTDPNDWTHDGRPEGWKMIDRAFTKAESRHIPNGPNSTADMAHPTRTGDLVVFSYPPYQFDAETPGTLVAPSHFFGQHGYVPDVQNLAANVNMRATFIAGGAGIGHGRGPGEVDRPGADAGVHARRPRAAAEPGQGAARRGAGWHGPTRRSRSSASTTSTASSTRRPGPTTTASTAWSAARSYLATMFDEDLASLPGPGLVLAGGDNVGASPPNSALLEDMPAIDVENAWGLDATSYGNHEFDYGVARLLEQQARADFPFLATNIVDSDTGRAPDWVTPSRVFRVNGVKIGVIGAGLTETPELVSAGATDGLTFLDEAPRIKAESERLRRRGVKVQVVVIHQGTASGSNPTGNTAGAPWDGPILSIADQLQSTTVDAMIVGHTHRISNLMRGRHPGHGGHQRRDQLLGAAADGEGGRRGLGRWRHPRGQDAGRGAPRRRAGDHRRRERGDRRAAQPGHRHAGDRHAARPDPAARVRRWATWWPTRCGPSTRAWTRPYTNSGGLRQDLVCAPAECR